ncbi:hypothetical protein H5P28_17285 [Ruficoccus amylovorans]|uniref:DUF1961 family protein n=1 Tax=Ruficoccus amylovorans TaxID=1804625 RepID=A0A842HHL9_9BACT|nr:hypothetical protein [Ruficoccus amylovorans]MBC2596023.1 hypothetical protein [Ruficoccus amylovorans]
MNKRNLGAETPVPQNLAAKSLPRRSSQLGRTVAAACALALPLACEGQESYREAYEAALAEPWEVVFEDSGQGDWSEKWFLDGRKATLENHEDGMFFAAGPIPDDNASHAVLWTKDSFEGDLKLEFDYTRMDTVYNYVNILFLYATGAGPEPYVEDIVEWSDLRTIPYMKTYFNHMNLLHISFAAYTNEPGATDASSYVRARRYPTSIYSGPNPFAQMALEPDFSGTGLFQPGVPHHITLVRKGDELFMNVSNADEQRLFRWDLSQKPPVNKGRIGLRHMWTRAATYANISVSEAASAEAAR